jgi:hypothetical protein
MFLCLSDCAECFGKENNVSAYECGFQINYEVFFCACVPLLQQMLPFLARSENAMQWAVCTAVQEMLISHFRGIFMEETNACWSYLV